MNSWTKLKTYINRFKDGNIISRGKILDHMMCDNRYARTLPLGWFIKEGSIDLYRRYLTKAGYLEWASRGKYRKVKPIPKGISRRDVQRMGYDVTNYAKGW